MRSTIFWFFSAVVLRHYYDCRHLLFCLENCSLLFDHKHEFLKELLTQLATNNKHKVSFKVDLHLRQF